MVVGVVRSSAARERHDEEEEREGEPDVDDAHERGVEQASLEPAGDDPDARRR